MNFKRIFSIALMVVMTFMLSTVAFAAAVDETSGAYTFGVTVSPETVTAGDTVTVSVWLTHKDGTEIKLGKNDATAFKFAFRMANSAIPVYYDDDNEEDVITGGVAYTTQLPSTKNSFTMGAANTTFKIDVSGFESTTTIDQTQPVSTFKFKTSETSTTGDYALTVAADACAIFDGKTATASLNPNVSDATLKINALATTPSHKVTYALNGGEGDAPTQADVEEGDTFTVAADPTRTGYTFDGWSDGVTSTLYKNPDTYTMGTTNVTLTAQWTENKTNAVVGTVPAATPAQLTGKDGQVYTNVWTNTYTITLGTTTVTGAKLNFTGHDAFDIANTVDWRGNGGTVIVKVAIVGAPLTDKGELVLTQN